MFCNRLYRARINFYKPLALLITLEIKGLFSGWKSKWFYKDNFVIRVEEYRPKILAMNGDRKE